MRVQRSEEMFLESFEVKALKRMQFALRFADFQVLVKVLRSVDWVSGT